MKKILTIISIMALLFGCAQNNDNTANNNVEKVYKNAYLDYEDVDEISTDADIIGIDITNSSKIFSAAKYVVVATVESIDGGSNRDLVDGGYVFPYTYGKLYIDKVYKGDIKEGSEVDYTRSGGIVSYRDWYNSLSQNEKEKHDFLSNGLHSEYVKTKLNDDIDIEAGKTYLMYMEDGNLRSNDEYMIAAWQAGLREISGMENAISDDYSSLKVLNNYTGQYELLSDVVK